MDVFRKINRLVDVMHELIQDVHREMELFKDKQQEQLDDRAINEINHAFTNILVLTLSVQAAYDDIHDKQMQVENGARTE